MKQFVIDKTSKKVLRFGYCDFASQDDFDSDNEEVVEKNIDLWPCIHEQDWYWNAGTEEFQKTPIS